MWKNKIIKKIIKVCKSLQKFISNKLLRQENSLKIMTDTSGISFCRAVRGFASTRSTPALIKRRNVAGGFGQRDSFSQK